MRVGEGVSTGGGVDFDRLELELRKLPDVVAVGFEGTDGEDSLILVHLLVSDPGARATVEEQALDLGRLHLGRPLRVVIAPEDDGAAPSSSDAFRGFTPVRSASRVEFLGVAFVDDGDSLEVTLGHGDRRAVGRGPTGSLAGAASAVLAALRQLGWSVPFQLESSVRLAVGNAGAVLVHLIGPDGDRLGISLGETAEQAAVKATLQALNRWLDDPSRRPVTARPVA